MLRVYALADGLLIQIDETFVRPAQPLSFDEIFSADDPVALLRAAAGNGETVADVHPHDLRAPLQNQEIWAAGVTYFRSRTARMEEARDAGGATFYDKVYDADRPELFFKATAHRVAAPGAAVRIRADSNWNVPEPELTLAINRAGRVFGYTIGNDMCSRDIEGENPLYLPQAKVYDGCAALGPCLVASENLPPPGTEIALEIRRNGSSVFNGTTSINQIKRPLASLAEWLFRENTFPCGCYLMTGTGIVPPDSFSLQRGDEISITIEPVGTLTNHVA